MISLRVIGRGWNVGFMALPSCGASASIIAAAQWPEQVGGVALRVLCPPLQHWLAAAPLAGHGHVCTLIVLAAACQAGRAEHLLVRPDEAGQVHQAALVEDHTLGFEHGTLLLG